MHSGVIGKTLNITTRSSRSFDKFVVQADVSLPLVTRELLQNMVDVISMTYSINCTTKI